MDRQLEEKPNYDQKRGETGLKLFDFMQNTADSWRRSNMTQKRELLGAISLNRLVSDVKLVLEKRKPFDIAAEGLSIAIGRSDCPDPERARGGMLWVDQFTQALAGDLAPHLLMAQRLLREVA